MPRGFLYFLQFKPGFCNKELLIWATVSSRCCFCWLFRGFSIFSCKEYNQPDLIIEDLVMSMCRILSCIVDKGWLLWPVCSLDKTLCPASFCTQWPTLPVTPDMSWLPTFIFSHVQLCNPMDSNLPGSAVRGIFQARILDWAAISYSTKSS